MKLAIFVDHFPILSQTFVLNQVTGLIDLGVDVTVVSLYSGSKPLADYPHLAHYQLDKHILYLNKSPTEPKGVLKNLLHRLRHIIVGLLRPATTLRTLKALRFWLYGHHGKSLLLASIAAQVRQPWCFDVILCHFGFNGVLAQKLNDIGVVKGRIATIFHGYEISAKTALQHYQQDYRTLFAHSALMLPVNALWQDKLLQLGCEAGKIQVQRMGVDLSLFKFDSTLHRTPSLRIFSVARFTEKKGIAYALRALAALQPTVAYHYYLGGYGELAESLLSLVKELKLEQNVTFLGALGQQQVIEQMRAADVFLQPSVTADNGDMEGVPLTIMEAMALGTVVVSTLHSGIPELITHGKHGLLAPERSATELAAHISLLYSDTDLYANLRTNARKRIEEMGNLAQLNQQLLNRLTSLITEE